MRRRGDVPARPTVMHEKKRLSQARDGVSDTARQACHRSSTEFRSDVVRGQAAPPNQKDFHHQAGKTAAGINYGQRQNTAPSDFR
jgi:hypothetical protein